MERRSFLKILSVGIASFGVSQCKFGETEQQHDEDILWEIFLFSAAYWGNRQYLQLSQENFNAIIRSRQIDEACKTLIKTYKNEISRTGDSSKTLENIYFGTVLSNDVKDKVIKTFININLMHGGFKVWGLKNYPGFIGGSFNTDTAKTPYRTHEN